MEKVWKNAIICVFCMDLKSINTINENDEKIIKDKIDNLLDNVTIDELIYCFFQLLAEHKLYKGGSK